MGNLDQEELKIIKLFLLSSHTQTQLNLLLEKLHSTVSHLSTSKIAIHKSPFVSFCFVPDLELAYYGVIITHVLLKGLLMNVCARRARVSSAVWNPTWRWSATSLKELWSSRSCSAQVGWNSSAPSPPVALLLNGIIGIMIKLRRRPPVRVHVTAFVHIYTFLLLRYGVSVGPDAGGLPLQSTLPWALQHV